jgi:hypothetical protein
MSKTNASATMFKIESGIPVPEHTRHGLYASKIAEMKVGDSTLVKVPGQVLSFRAAAKNAGCSIIAHKNDDGTFRIWKSDKPTQTRKTSTKGKKAESK